MGGEIRYGKASDRKTFKNCRKSYRFRSTAYLDPPDEGRGRSAKDRKIKKRSIGWIQFLRNIRWTKRFRQYPFELSGRNDRRIMISRWSKKPKLVIADEANTGTGSETCKTCNGTFPAACRYGELLFWSLHGLWSLRWKQWTGYRYFMPDIR